MLSELNKVPIADDETIGYAEAAVLAVSLLVGIIAHPFSWLFLAFSVYAAISAAIEYEKSSEPEKHPQGYLGLGTQPWLDDAAAAAVGAIVFVLAAVFDLYLIAAVLTAAVAFIFFAAQSLRQTDGEERANREHRYS